MTPAPPGRPVRPYSTLFNGRIGANQAEKLGFTQPFPNGWPSLGLHLLPLLSHYSRKAPRNVLNHTRLSSSGVFRALGAPPPCVRALAGGALRRRNPGIPLAHSPSGVSTPSSGLLRSSFLRWIQEPWAPPAS